MKLTDVTLHVDVSFSMFHVFAVAIRTSGGGFRPEKFVAGEFVFVVTDSSGAKAYGFCRRVLPCGPGGR